MERPTDQESQPKAIAARVRALIFAQDRPRLAAVARRLKVEDLALRRTVHDTRPFPDPDVLAAIVWDYGVDPTWLLTGVYDSITHRSATETSTRATLAGMFRGLLARREPASRSGEARKGG